MRAVVMTATGGREVLEQIERPEPVAGPGEALVEIAVAGVNFMDIGVRQGIAWTDMPNPKILGVEGVGRVLAVGEGVEAVQPGQRVAWVYAPGSYAERVAIPATSLVPVPDAVDDRTAASIMMQGLTASHFATDFYPVLPGDIAFVHAAAGGLGLLLTQIIKLRGGQVIGRVSSEEKVATAREAGADHVIVDTEGRFAEEALRLTDGEGVHVVYDGSGPTTFQGSLDVLRRSGTFCWYGPVLGGPGPLDIMSLPRSIKIGYAVFFDHIHTPELLRKHAAQLFQWVADGRLKVRIGGEYALADAAKAFSGFKRERAKLTASRLHLGNRKYEAPALTKDYETWKEDAPLLGDGELEAAEEIRRRDEPLPRLNRIEFDAASIATAFQFITEICGQSMAMVALDEVQRFPDMLLWLKQGHEFHDANALEDCLFCGSPLLSERRALLASAFDSHVDQFVARLAKTAERLQSVMGTLAQLAETVPIPDALVTELRVEFEQYRSEILRDARQARTYLAALQDVLSVKRERPATPADMSSIAAQSDVENTVQALAKALEAANAAIGKHNLIVGDFAKHKENAEIAIRKHFIADCYADFASHAKELDDAKGLLTSARAELETLSIQADQLRQQIKEHGPAAGAINKLVASYLGHGELTIHPVDQGYALHRHGKPIKGVPSEGEKTAIAIAYFLSSLEAEGRKLKDLIVVVDDPVSSLDTKALNYACALVRSRLENAGQVFVMTHNLQCMNEFRKAWKGRAKPPEGREATATFLFLDVCVPTGQDKRTSHIVEMSRLLREYDSEYHFLFSHVLNFIDKPDTYYDHGYMMPNVLRRVLDVFLAFKCPGSSGFVGQIQKLCADYPGLDRDRLAALERLAQVESHSDNLDDLLSFSSMTIEEGRQAATALIEVIDHVDSKHLAGLRRLCR